jgi:hypothetical protein
VKCSEVLQCSDVLLVLFYRCVYGCTFCILLFNSVSYVFLLLCLCILIVFMLCSVYSVFIVPTGILLLPLLVSLCFFLSCKTDARAFQVKTGHDTHSSKLANCVVLCIVFV